MPARAFKCGPALPATALSLLIAGALLWSSTASLAQESPDGTRIHRVRPGENLSWIASKNGVTVRELQRWNDLRGSRILPGQELRIPQQGAEVYTVRRGDTLGEIAQRYRVSVDLLRQLNGLRGSRIHPGQKLTLQPTRQDEPVHTVRRGDTLLSISRASGVSLATIRELNGLRGDRIHPGQELRVRRGAEAPRWATHVVRRGDTLGEIARLHQMSLRQLRSANALSSSVIHPGQRLRVRPLLGDDDRGIGLLAASEIPWDDLVPRTKAVPMLLASNGPYLYSKPRAAAQRSSSHREGSAHGPRTTYDRASRLWQAFEGRVKSIGRLSRDLEGVTVILDPGHGGLDPGAIVPTRVEGEKTVHVVEDEYVYDIALRAAVLLTLHGADVDLTLLSPNHLIRSNAPASATFVNEQNEVYNSATINRRNVARAWPRGGNQGLANRVRTIRELEAAAGSNKTILLSLHADNSPRSPEAVTVFHARRDRDSRRFARTVLPAFGAGARVRDRNFYVLRNSTADLSLLIELRNLAHSSHAWALRDAKLRHRDAEKVVKGLLDWARSEGYDGRVAAGR